MPRGVRNVQVPGQSAQAEPEALRGSPETSPTGADAAPDLPRPTGGQSIPPLGPQIAEMAASAVTAILRAADVDPSKLKRAVLTADGWVCPEKSPAPVARE